MKQGAPDVKDDQRRSRALTTAATRQQLMSCAGDVFADVGFQSATVEAIVARAGFTRGAFYAHFTDKADLFVTLLEESRADDLDRVRNLLATTSGDDTQAAVQAWFDGLASQNRWELAYAELWPQAVRNPALRARLAVRQDQVRGAIAEMISNHCHTAGIVLPMPVDQVAGLMLALADGVAAQRHLDPTVLPRDAFTTATALLWTGLLART